MAQRLSNGGNIVDIATPVDRHRIFDDPWCPLYGKIPDVLNGSGDELTGQCIRIIEESRKIWMCAAISEEKLKTANELWDLFRIHQNLISNGHPRTKSITTESICETIVTESRKLSFSSVDKIADTEILAMYTIHVVFSALKDLWEPLDRMGIDDILYFLYSSPLLDKDSYIKAEIYIARLLLSQANKIVNQTQKETVNKITSSLTPLGAKRSELETLSLFYDDAKGILFSEDGKHCALTGDEQTLFDYLKKGDEYVDAIIKHFCNKKEYSSTNWDRRNFDKLNSDLNKKSRSAFGVTLIENLKKGSGKYGLFAKVKDRKFKK